MAYFTRSMIKCISVEMYEQNERFLKGASGNDEEDLGVLIMMQQRALVLGEYLESLGPDYSKLVAVLEGCCNLIYDISENLKDIELVKFNAYKIASGLVEFIDLVDEKIVEISNIDVYDFRNLVETKSEKLIVSKEINRMYEFCASSLEEENSEEIEAPLVVGNY